MALAHAKGNLFRPSPESQRRYSMTSRGCQRYRSIRRSEQPTWVRALSNAS